MLTLDELIESLQALREKAQKQFDFTELDQEHAGELNCGVNVDKEVIDEINLDGETLEILKPEFEIEPTGVFVSIPTKIC